MSLKTIILSVVVASMVAVAMVGRAQEPPAPAEVVSAGYDLFTTDPATTDLLGIPFEGDASVRPTFDFVPPPLSADGRRAIGDTDTIVHRLEDASVTAVPGTADPIAIELVLLRLVSTIDFDVDGDGSTDGPIFVTLQKDRNPAGEVRLDFDVPPPAEGEPPPPPGPIRETVLPGPRSFGEMTITFGSAAGGTFDSFLEIFADLRNEDGEIICGETIGLPPCAALDAGLVLQSDGSAWGRQAVPESITIRGVNFSLAAPDRTNPVDPSTDFWAGVDPAGKTVCVRHGGHPDPEGAFTLHGTCRTLCTTQALSPESCRNGKDDDCNGTIDDCDEDLFGPSVTAPPDRTFECVATDPDIRPSATGIGTATDNCFPRTLTPGFEDFPEEFPTYLCGRTFLVDRIWSATDDCGNPASMPDLQQIRVVDTTPPNITCPEARTILWTGDRSPLSLGNASGSDVCLKEDEQVGIDFSDESDPGVCRSEEITRTWLATDSCGLETPCDQLISVRGPKDAIEDLAALVPDLGLRAGREGALLSLLENAADAVCANNPTSAVRQLEAFINQMNNLSGREIDPADAGVLIAAAQAIIDAIQDPVNGGACPAGCADPGGDGGGDGGGGAGDSDGDGVPDADDACPASDTDPTVVIDGCDSGVDNVDSGDGCTVSDRIVDCADTASNHGLFVRCVNELQAELEDAGLISGGDGSAIQSCAAGAGLP